MNYQNPNIVGTKEISFQNRFFAFSYTDTWFRMESLLLISSLPIILLFFTMFLVVYLIAYFIVFRDWSRKRPEASSCLISLAHSTPALFLASHAILSDPNPGFASVNTSWQNVVLDYSIAYFLMDLSHYLVFYPSDVLFIGHHLATLFVFLTCRFVVVRGACAILFLLILAEVTSFCQNTWTLAAARKADSAFAAKVFDFLSPPFYALYSVVRGLIAPVFMYKMGVFYMSGAADDAIPRWVWASWIFVVLMAISVSLVWISNLWVQLYRERTLKVEKKN